jgi:hypothetical protein
VWSLPYWLSHLGIEAQQAAVERYLNGGNWKVVETFTEIESGRNSERPALAKALAAAVRQVPADGLNVCRSWDIFMQHSLPYGGSLPLNREI